MHRVIHVSIFSRISYLALLAALVFAIAATSCDSRDGGPQAPSDKTPVVYTTFYPTQYFSSRITGDLARVVCPVPPDADALFWKPDAETIAAMQDADLIVLNGANLEKWLDTVTLPTERMVDTTHSFHEEFIELEAITHSHGPEGEHTHEGTDSHTWLDPINALAQAKSIHAALVKRLPHHRSSFDSNFSALTKDLHDLDGLFKALGKPPSTLLASHPAYNYVARRYGWPVINFDLDPETLPDEKALEDVAKVADAEKARYLFWESAPIPAVAQAFEVMGLTNIEFSPVELHDPATSSSKDYLDLMRENLQRLTPAFK